MRMVNKSHSINISYLRQGSIRTRFPGILKHNNQAKSILAH